MRTHSTFFKVMHWLVALCILGAFIIAWSIDEHGGFTPQKLKMINYHKWIGFSVLILFIPRLISSLKGYSKLPVNNVQDKIAKLVHYGLYVTMFLTPFLGWLMSSAKGFPVVWLGMFPIPDLIDKNIGLGKILKEAHELSAGLLLTCLIAHIGGAIFRQFIKKDKIISKMF